MKEKATLRGDDRWIGPSLERNVVIDLVGGLFRLGLADDDVLTPDRHQHDRCRDDRRIAPAMVTARSSSTFSRLLSAASAKTEPDRAIRPSNTKHSSSAIDDTASITSSDGSSCSKVLRMRRDSILPIRPRANPADVTTLRSRSSRRSIKIEINSGNGRAQRQASARIPGWACRNSLRKASGDSSEPRRARLPTTLKRPAIICSPSRDFR
jgi:hypothetical protein